VPGSLINDPSVTLLTIIAAVVWWLGCEVVRGRPSVPRRISSALSFLGPLGAIALMLVALARLVGQ